MTVSATSPIAPLGQTKLFKPLKVGRYELPQRIAFAPSTRCRATFDNIPTDLQLQYYKERAQYPGTLIITEATYSSAQGGLNPHIPGIFNDAQVKAWKKINDEIHAAKSLSSVQLWYLGRVANPVHLKNAGLPFVAPSPVYWSEESEQQAKECGNELRELTLEEIDDLVENTYPQAAKNALAAGFDYVEIHSAHGYMLDQFLNTASNKRTDQYGGSIENRARLLLRIIDKLIPIVGADRLAVRLSPWARFQNVDTEGEEIHKYILTEFQKRADEGNQLAYVSLVEPRVQASWDVSAEDQIGSNAFASKYWKGVFMKAGSYTYDAPEFKSLLTDLEDDRTFIGFSRYFISCPDLVHRLKEGLSLTPYERATFYTQDNWGFNTWNKFGENNQWNEEEETKIVGKALA
ncbi:uncharacterized protein SPAPADRAFT_63220 [Spathaspora passalidarum NRRL Y-27907]|uniref:Probable NADPH dehydrogenase n=1 Tax=Spathaspora passalidarum (strain NRRL Y-27907 / 11-Y1) TaxID=619300 RepID=G3ATZ2_SPAPN|nr:uncharacterized protein SPAPADRAFT_63220 [Spathaspora passalidarum NRRL Y-27907]EGW30368.1 hypothetical protein SPAPADRAFT_63220 [Spathaspora passalidarum NRRL Y-27907]